MKKIFKIVVGFGLITSCATKNTSKETTPIQKNLTVIDAHVHTSFDNKPNISSSIDYSESQLVKEFKENNIVAAVSMNAYSGKGYHDFSKVSDNSTKVIHCVGISIPPNYKTIERDIKSKKYSCIKIYLGYIHAFAYDKVYRPLYSIAEKYNVPVVFHTGDTYSTQGKLKYSDPLTIDEVAVDFPKVKFVIAHLGNPWVQSAAEVVYKNPNVYADASAFLIGKLVWPPRTKPGPMRGFG